MNPTAEQIQKINHFSKVPIDLCERIASIVKIMNCEPKEKLLSEGDTGDTMVVVFQGQVEVSKNMLVYVYGKSHNTYKDMKRCIYSNA